MINRYITFVFSLIFIISSITLNAQNLIVNGGFEESSLSGNFRTFRVGEEFKGWKVIQATVDLNNSGPFSHSGRNSIDLNGTPGVGGIAQTFQTKKGKKYKLSFYLSGNTAGFPKVKKMRVNVGDQKAFYEFDIRGKTSDNMGWQLQEVVFEALKNETTVQFYSTEGHENPYWGPIIDDVSVIPVSGGLFSHSSEQFFEFNYGLLGGVSYYFIDKSEHIDLYKDGILNYKMMVEEAGLGYHIGFHSQFRAGPIFLRPDIMLNTNNIVYEINNAQTGANSTRSNERYVYLDIPVLLGFKYKLFRFMGGPVGHVFLYNHSNLDTSISELSTDFKTFTLGYQAGIGIDVAMIGLDLRYEGNFNKLGDGILYNDQKIYFSKAPGRILATLTFRIN